MAAFDLSTLGLDGDEQSVINDGKAIERWLNDPIVLRAFAKTKDRLFNEWQHAKTAEEAGAIWSKMKALDSIWQSFESMKGAGDMAQHARERRDALEATRAPRKGASR